MSAAIIAILTAALQLVPQIPELIAGIQTAIDLVTSGTDPTPAQQAAIDAALDAANAKLQGTA